MDYLHIVKTDEAYSPDNIADPRDRGIVEGYELAAGTVERALANMEAENDLDGTVVGRIKNEHIEEIAAWLARWLESDRAKFVISAIENQTEGA